MGIDINYLRDAFLENALGEEYYDLYEDSL